VFNVKEKFSVNVMNGVCGTLLLIALRDVTKMAVTLGLFDPFAVECQGD
jgi:hypothetical protein